MQGEKVDIGGKKGPPISIAAKRIVTQRWPQIKIMEFKQMRCFA